MSEQKKMRLSWVFVFFTLIAGYLLFNGMSPVIASDDHEQIRDMQDRGEIISLSELIDKAGLSEMKILEAELEREHGVLVYEIEFLDTEGRVHERYFNAITGEPLKGYRGD